jgi:hypothetical protein
MAKDPLKRTQDDGTIEEIDPSTEETALQPEESSAPQPTKVSSNLNISSASRTIKVGS